jgi:hypothetical protein
MTIVIIFSGKGYGHADWITTKLFNTKEEAEQFVKETTDLESKFWYYAVIVEDGKNIEPYIN